VRIAALDIGEKRIGVAISDPGRRVATPLKVLDAAVLRDPGPLLRLLEDYEVGLVVVGLPLSLDGTEGPQARAVRASVARLGPALGVPIEFADERLSSAQASRALGDAGLSDRAKRGRIDMAAASLFLQSYLDARRAPETQEAADETQD
jgi:putative Holliday junction resolvase